MAPARPDDAHRAVTDALDAVLRLFAASSLARDKRAAEAVRAALVGPRRAMADLSWLRSTEPAERTANDIGDLARELWAMSGIRRPGRPAGRGVGRDGGEDGPSCPPPDPRADAARSVALAECTLLESAASDAGCLREFADAAARFRWLRYALWYLERPDSSDVLEAVEAAERLVERTAGALPLGARAVHGAVRNLWEAVQQADERGWR